MLNQEQVSSLKCFFCFANRPKPKDSSFTIIYDKEKVAKPDILDAGNVFRLKNYRNYYIDYQNSWHLFFRLTN